ncbi:MAG: hypothetical protein E6K76_00580 [Candidatus Eisenbacteria bacterium]|uniref:SMP-30/Gluconolactonase/LRE-like region domain-containing protein n=1 Tax=Eiseniibacteriota bacterium TaxID=2212470 RepID=A0A538TB24_UNCEI|nr:MAG: hypothetical protein E6K76_00580 [Candidatus Eisenbacteria bacterium]
MSGPTGKTLIAVLAALACLAGPHRDCRAADREAADSTSSSPPGALRTEWTFDQDALEAVGIRRPSRLAYDSDGNLHVLDAETRRITKLDPRGRVLYEVGGYGSDETSLELPQDVALDRDQSLLVLDRGRGALVAFDRAGRFLGRRPFQGAASEESRSADARLVLDRFGKLWLLSARTRDLLPLDDRLEPARATRYLVPEDSLLVPLAAAAGARGEVWIYDAARGALRRFDASGRLAFTVSLDPLPKAVSISDLAVDRGGFLYAADRAGQRILVIGPDGATLLTRVLGGDRVPWRPAALAIGPRGQIAVADPGRGEIQVLVPERTARP